MRLSRDKHIPATFTYVHRLREHREHYYVTVAYNGLTPHGRHRFSYYAEDVSRQAAAQEALVQSEENLRTVLQSIPTPTIIYRGEKILYTNPPMEKLTGYSLDELYSMPIWTFLHPSSVNTIRSFAAARLRGERVPDRYEMNIVTKAGEARCIDFHGRLAQFENAPAVIGTGYDITERKSMEENLERQRNELEETRNFLDSVLENIPLMLSVKDAATLRYVRLNRAGEEFLGVRRTEIVGRTDADHLPPDQARASRATDDATLAHEGPSAPIEEVIDTPGKGSRILQTRKVPLLGAEGTPRYLLGISVDVTERKPGRKRARAVLHGSDAGQRPAEQPGSGADPRP